MDRDQKMSIPRIVTIVSLLVAAAVPVQAIPVFIDNFLEGFTPYVSASTVEPLATNTYESPLIWSENGDVSVAVGAPTQISGLPAYTWWHGCTPTSAGMVLGFWDSNGFSNLVDGDASTQGTGFTDNVNKMMASQEHYDDYALPLDTGSSIKKDKSELGGAHASNSLADFMHTSWSADGLAYGWTWITTSMFANYGLSYGMKTYTEYVGYAAQAYTDYWGANVNAFWDSYATEIDAGNPMVLAVDSNGDGDVDHNVAAVGYDMDDQGNKQYAYYNTWDKNLHWSAWQAPSTSQSWGVGFGSYYHPTDGQTETPEPSTLALMAVVGAGWLVKRRRRRN